MTFGVAGAVALMLGCTLGWPVNASPIEMDGAWAGADCTFGWPVNISPIDG